MRAFEIGFGGGCHWCTEAVFNALRGVRAVAQGFIRSTPPNEALSEAVLIEYHPDEIPLTALIEIHLRTHASTSNHTMRDKYRSAIYSFDDAQHVAARNALAQAQSGFDKPLITQVLPFAGFQPSPPHFENYADKHADGPFCTRYIDPKLALLRRAYGTWLKPGIDKKTL